MALKRVVKLAGKACVSMTVADKARMKLKTMT
jgi:hypothetical protein